MFKRIGLFLMVNFAVMFTVMLVMNLLGVNHYMTKAGIDYSALLVFCLLYGMVGAFISLLISKKMAVWMMRLKVIKAENANQLESQLLTMVHRLSSVAGLPKNPDVAIYDSPEVNAFATGPTRSNSLVAVSSGLLHSMNEAEVEGVVAHEVAHIANGDMVTLTLIQGVINAFVMFFAKAAAWALANFMQGDDEESSPNYFMVMAIEMAFYVVFGMLGAVVVAWFSRFREYRADAGAAKLAGKEKIISALEKLNNLTKQNQPYFAGSQSDSLANFKISSSQKSWASFFSSHPPLEERIATLRKSY